METLELIFYGISKLWCFCTKVHNGSEAVKETRWHNSHGQVLRHCGFSGKKGGCTQRTGGGNGMRQSKAGVYTMLRLYENKQEAGNTKHGNHSAWKDLREVRSTIQFFESLFCANHVLEDYQRLMDGSEAGN